MTVTSVQNILLGLIVVVPGFIATHVIVSLGVFRSKISRWELLIVSLSMSLFIDSIFFSIVQMNGGSINDVSEVSSVFFTPQFRPELVFGLIGISLVIGVLGAVFLAANIHKKVREDIWDRVSGNRRRSFHEPWEGSLDEASRVQVLTSDGAMVVGGIKQYSDDGKEKQLSLTGAEWKSPSSDGWVDPDTDVELLFGDDIRQVTIVDTNGEADSSSDGEGKENGG